MRIKLQNIIRHVVASILTGQTNTLYQRQDTKMGPLFATKWIATNKVAKHNVDILMVQSNMVTDLIIISYLIKYLLANSGTNINLVKKCPKGQIQTRLLYLDAKKVLHGAQLYTHSKTCLALLVLSKEDNEALIFPKLQSSNILSLVQVCQDWYQVLLTDKTYSLQRERTLQKAKKIQ